MRQLGQEGRSPQIIALENVYGTLTSNQGRDFAAISSALSGAKYRFGAMVINARWFVPQSRPRLFVIGVRNDIRIPRYIEASGPSNVWHPLSLINAYNKLTREALSRWIWWNLPKPVSGRRVLADLIEETPSGVEWHTPSETEYILSLMSERNRAKVEAAKEQGVKLLELFIVEPGLIKWRQEPSRGGPF
jgi:DNA (cytosine-5)-methyltransferase 1